METPRGARATNVASIEKGLSSHPRFLGVGGADSFVSSIAGGIVSLVVPHS